MSKIDLQQSPSSLEESFHNPPAAARPHVWWHWMNGNITKEGIALDIEWMERVGVAGLHAFDAGWDTPQVVENRLKYMTPEWKDAFRYALAEATKRSFEVGIACSPGWSETGGPWITPAQAMKKLVWTETRIAADAKDSIVLAQPHSATGTFQNYPNQGHAVLGHAGQQADEVFYADAKVVAFPLPKSEQSAARILKISSSAGAIEAERLADNDYSKGVELPVPEDGGNAWISFDYDEPLTIQSLSLAMAPDNWARPKVRRPAPTIGALEASDDGETYYTVAEIPGWELGRTSAVQHTISFAPTTARHFRVIFFPPPLDARYRTSMFAQQSEGARSHHIGQLVLRTGARTHRFEEKAGFGTLLDYYAFPTHPVTAEDIVASNSVIDLTAFMEPSGRLNWKPGEGEWVVLRVGFSLLGTKNHPASPEATGLEVDKLNKDHVKSYLDQYLALYEDASNGHLGQGGLHCVTTDSWEAGIQNWTEGFPDLFRTYAGYEIAQHLPALFGWIVDGVDQTEGFLWDFRKTIGDLVVDNHYGEIRRGLTARGLVHYGESMERERPTLGDGMAMKARTDVPMGAYWTRRELNEDMPNYGVDLQESASVAHIYGQNLVAAESLTTQGRTNGWSDSPRSLKPFADMMMALGVNRFVMHTSVHQPLVGPAPGLTLGPYGQHFNRNDTWAEQAVEWVSYISRCCQLLQAGNFVADIAYFYGEEAPITAIFAEKPVADIPEGYSYDFFNRDALLNELSVADGVLKTASGMRYRVIYASGRSQKMTVAVLRRLKQLLVDGAVVISNPPEASPSLADDQAEFDALVGELWGNAGRGHLVRGIGKGRLYSGYALDRALNNLRIAPDFSYTRSIAETKLLHVHRRTPDADIYFVNNRLERVEKIELSFRVTGRQPELWHPETGAVSPLGYEIRGEHTYVPVELQPNETIFVVFRELAAETRQSITLPDYTTIAEIQGPWTMTFQPGRGAPSGTVAERLFPWNESAEEGVRYFSGTARYAKSLTIKSDQLRSADRLILDLGDVREVAELTVNGEKVGTRWTLPYRFDVSQYLREGENRIEVDVTNLWVNRLIGDEQPGVREKFTFTALPVYSASSQLAVSGMLGPVQLKSTRNSNEV